MEQGSRFPFGRLVRSPAPMENLPHPSDPIPRTLNPPPKKAEPSTPVSKFKIPTTNLELDNPTPPKCHLGMADPTPPALDSEKTSLNWRTTLPAIGLALLSTVEEASLFDIQFKGNGALAGLAAVIFLWPLIRQIGSRGGSTELFGLKLQVNSLERRTEEDYALQLEQLQSDLEDLRQTVTTQSTPAATVSRSSAPTTPEPDATPFLSAVAEYQRHRAHRAWRERVAIDKRITAGAGRLPCAQLRQLYQEAEDRPSVAAATAVALGVPYPNEPDTERAEFLVELLDSESERARYRAALSIARLAKRFDTSGKARALMRHGVQQALNEEKSASVTEKLTLAYTTLS